jgi:hypothetical protein
MVFWSCSEWTGPATLMWSNECIQFNLDSIRAVDPDPDSKRAKITAKVEKN